MSSLAVAVPPLLDSNEGVIGLNINEEDDGPLLADGNNNCHGPSSPNGNHLIMGANALPPLLDSEEVEARAWVDDDEVEVEARALVDEDDTWQDNNVIVRPERNIVRRAIVEPHLLPFRDFSNLHHRDHPDAPPHVPILGSKRSSERLLARTRCFRLAPKRMPFNESDNEWGPPSFPVLDADEDSDNTSSSSTEDDEE